MQCRFSSGSFCGLTSELWQRLRGACLRNGVRGLSKVGHVDSERIVACPPPPCSISLILEACASISTKRLPLQQTETWKEASARNRSWIEDSHRGSMEYPHREKGGWKSLRRPHFCWDSKEWMKGQCLLMNQSLQAPSRWRCETEKLESRLLSQRNTAPRFVVSFSCPWSCFAECTIRLNVNSGNHGYRQCLLVTVDATKINAFAFLGSVLLDGQYQILSRIQIRYDSRTYLNSLLCPPLLPVA